MLTSSGVVNGELLDAFKCETKENGVEKSLPLSWSGVPSSTKSLAIIMHHYPNAPDVTIPNAYLILWAIDPSVIEIPYGAADDGPWYMGPNKDGNTVSYTSPCSQNAGTKEYTITVYALDQTPASLPASSSVDVTYSVLTEALSTVNIIDTAVLTFNDVNTGKNKLRLVLE